MSSAPPGSLTILLVPLAATTGLLATEYGGTPPTLTWCYSTVTDCDIWARPGVGCRPHEDAHAAVGLVIVRDDALVATGCDRARRVLAEHLGLDPSGGVILTKQCPRGAKRWAWILEDWNGERAELDPLSNEVDPAKFLAGYGAARGLWRAVTLRNGVEA